MTFVPFQYLGRDLQVLESPVGARADENLVNLDALGLVDWLGVIDRMRKGHLGHQVTGLDLYDPLVGRILVRFNRPEIPGPAHLLQVVFRHIIGGDQADFGAGLDRHVRENQP